MNIPIRRRVACMAAASCLLLGSMAVAADVTGGADGISLSGIPSDASNVRLSGPDGAVTRGERLADGLYKYEVIETRCISLSAAEIDAARRNNAANGRAEDAQPSNCRDVVVDSGSFRIVNGVVPNSALAEE